MKRYTLKIVTTSLIICLFSLAANATIWRVNLDPDAVADFTTSQAAHDAASPGDTLFIEPAKSSQGPLTLSKQLFIMGVGYFLEDNYPNASYPNAYSTAGPNYPIDYTFNPGSQGSVLTGLYVSSIDISAGNITIKGNYLSGDINLSLGADNCIIENNYVRGFGSSADVTNTVIRNNRFRGTINVNESGMTFYNNILGGGSFTNQLMYNNINIGGNNITLINCVLSNNIDARVGQTGFGTSDGNFGNVAESVIFVGGASTDGEYQLRSGSPAIGAGINGEDCGMFGGSNPYKLSGLPPIPVFTKFTKPGIGNDTTPLQTTISLESNN